MTAPAQDKDKVTPPPGKTTGERGYDILQFSLGKVWIIVSSVWLAYVARYGKEEYHFMGAKVPNYLRKMQTGFHNLMLDNRIFPMRGRGEFWEDFAGANANTFLTCHGGNFFAPMMLWLENDRGNIAAFFNRHIGKPGEEEIGRERMKDLPKQTWGDIIKGRVGGWAIVMGSFLTANHLLGKDKKLGRKKFDIYEEKFGRLMAGWFGDASIARVPISQELTEVQAANKMYRFGRIAALDIYATTAALLIWTAISRMSAKKREDRKNGNGHRENEAALEPKEEHKNFTGREMRQARFSDGFAHAVAVNSGISAARE